jgi:Uma2 family endonuclease
MAKREDWSDRMLNRAEYRAVQQQVGYYPDSDGQPMADNTLQFEWIVTIKGGLEAYYQDQEDVFVAGDLLWYPTEGSTIRRAPDAMVVFGRPKGYRGSYKQWEEGNIAPQVVFEVLSPGNTIPEMQEKYRFYNRHGVEEYYIYNPEQGSLVGFHRENGWLVKLPAITLLGWVSPRMAIRFAMDDQDLLLIKPNGERFMSYVEIDQQRQQERARRINVEQQMYQKQQEWDKIAQQNAILAAKLRELGIDPDTIVLSH